MIKFPVGSVTFVGISIDVIRNTKYRKEEFDI